MRFFCVWVSRDRIVWLCTKSILSVNLQSWRRINQKNIASFSPVSELYQRWLTLIREEERVTGNKCKYNMQIF